MKRRILATLLAAVILVSIIQSAAFAAPTGGTLNDTSAIDDLEVGKPVRVSFKGGRDLDWLMTTNMGAVKMRYTYFLFDDDILGGIMEHPVFCIAPNKSGAYELMRDRGADGNDGADYALYEIAGTDATVLQKSIVNQGWPTYKLSTLGFSDDEAGREMAYYATKIALWAAINDGANEAAISINPGRTSDGDAQKVLDAARAILKRGKGNTALINHPVKTKIESVQEITDDYIIENMTVRVPGYVGLSSAGTGKIELELLGATPVPAGTVVLDKNQGNTDIYDGGAGDMQAQSRSTGQILDGYVAEITVKYPITDDMKDAAGNLYWTEPQLHAEAIVGANEWVVLTYKGGNIGQPYLAKGASKEIVEASITPLASGTRNELEGDQGLIIKKLETGTNKPLGGAIFKIFDENMDLIMSAATADADGILNVPLQHDGQYHVQEIVPPEFHLLPSQGSPPADDWQHPWVEYNQVTTVTFHNDPYGRLEVFKADAYMGWGLDDAVIQIRQIGGQGYTDTQPTSNGGYAIFDRIPVGAYEVWEVASSSGYVLDSTHHSVNVTSLKEGVSGWSIRNIAMASLLITKLDNQNNPVPGVTFEVKRNAQTFGTYTTNAMGYATVPNLDPGTYTVEEISCPDGYVNTREIQTIYITGQESVVPVVFHNFQTPGIHILKLDRMTRVPLDGVTFQLDQLDGPNHYTLQTSGGGLIDLRPAEANLAPGTYEVRETITLPGYLIDDSVRTVVLANDGRTTPLVFTDTKKPGLRVIKWDSVNQVTVPGAVFTFTKMEDFAVSFDRTVQPNGEIFIDGFKEDNLVPGVYRVVEKMAPAGYALDTTPHYVELYAGHTSEITIENLRLPDVTFWKYDAVTQTPLNDAEFSIRSFGEAANISNPGAVGTLEWSGKITKDGHVTVGDYKNADGFGSTNGNNVRLSTGWTRFTEIGAPPDYINDHQYFDVYLEPGKHYDIKFDNYKKPRVILRKYDGQTQEPLSLAEFSLQKVNGATVWETQIGGEGVPGTESGSNMVISPYLDPGDYTLWEIGAPPGYLNLTMPRNIRLEPGKDLELKIDNWKKPQLIVRKYDKDTAELLPDAEFSLSFTDGPVVWEGMTDADGKIVLTGLEPGKYSLDEMAPPPGYIDEHFHRDITIVPGAALEIKVDNRKKPDLKIIKTDAITGNPVADVEFSVRKDNTTEVQSVRTDAHGEAFLKELEPGVYIVTETRVPDNYLLTKDPVQSITLAPAQHGTVRFKNYRKPTLTINKIDSITGDPLKNVRFSVVYASNSTFTGEINDMGFHYTDAAGQIFLDKLTDGWYKVTEVAPASGYIIKGSAVQEFYVEAGRDKVVTFENTPKSAIIIKKIDNETGLPVPGATFTVRFLGGTSGSNGTIIREDVTSINGTIVIAGLKPGTYVVEETSAASGYELSNPSVQTAVITDDEQAIVQLNFSNAHKGNLIILKKDSVTKQPLAGATFKVSFSDGAVIGSGNGEYVTDSEGVINLSEYLPVGSTVIVTEIKAPDGYLLDSATQTIKIKENTTHSLTFFDYPMSSAQIIKIDAGTKAPLKDAQFTVYRQSGEVVGKYTTNGDGIIILPTLAPGWYKATETKAPDGYLLDDIPQDFQITNNQFVKLVFENKQLSSLQIRKVSETDGAPLAAAVFEVRKQNGEYVGEYTTGKDGAVSISNAAPGWYIVSETKAPTGYILDSTAKTVEVKPVTPTVVTFSNKPLAGLQIVKLNSATRQPIEGAEFSVAKMDGERVGTYKTDKAGTIYVSELVPGWYTVTELKAADRYMLDAEPRNVEITWGKLATIEVLNTPMSGLLIVKTDEATHKPLKGVVFDVRRADGQYVTGNILDGNQPSTENNSPNGTFGENGSVSGSYTTDANGRIQISGLGAGQYMVVERKALDGYELDTEVHAVTVTPGKLSTLQLTNRQKAGLHILKVDSVTKKGIYNVEFMVFDGNSQVVGTYNTDNNGIIDFAGILTEGRYTIRETRAADGYYRDDLPRTVEFKSGKVTEIVWENTPQMAQIQITKKSGDSNEVNGLEAGSPLSGAVFEVYNYKSGNLVDRFVSGTDGRAISKPLPLGRYTVKEVQAPMWYKISAETLDIELEFATQIIKRDFLNYSANTGVTIRKTGNKQAMPGDLIRYDIKEVRNTSTVSLTDFYWRDILPTDAVRLTKIVTGTYNQSIKYKVMATTNKGDTIILADNLSTLKNNVVDCVNAALGLRSDEYITSFALMFGTVKAGFAEVEKPQIYVKVQMNLPNGYQFANKADVAGKYGSEWVAGNAKTVTEIYAQPVKLPRTGF